MGTHTDDDRFLLHRNDIWVDTILPFVGPGHFIFVAAVSKRMKELYEAYYGTITPAPLLWPRWERPALSNTYLSAAFSSVSRVEYCYNVLGNRFPANHLTYCELATKHGSFEVVKWVNMNRFPMNENAMTNAIRKGNLQVVTYLRENGCPWDATASMTAAQDGNLHLLKFLHRHGCPIDQFSCAAAANHGHLEVLQYLHENDCPWNEDACANAAEGGHLEVLQYLHEKGCPWSNKTCNFAAIHGHLEVLKYARTHGCPWTVELLINASNLDAVKYLYENECGCHWDVLQYLLGRLENDFAYLGNVFQYGVDDEIFEWAVANGCPYASYEGREQGQGTLR